MSTAEKWDAGVDQPVPAERIAAFASELTYERIPPEVIDRAKLLILDALGVGLASNAFDFAGVTLQGTKALAGSGSCSVIGRPDRLPVRDAAMVNGLLIHGLDFDDTHLASIIHATAACLPTALSLGEHLGADGRSILAAYAAGMETAIRIGLTVDGGFHHTGFHATGVVAHFSSAVVAGRLLGLSARQIQSAQGIAASTASGVQVFLEEGAWTKRFHPGWAAVAGITAAYLAQADFRGPSRPYEGKFGLLHTHLQSAHASLDTDKLSAELGSRWELAETAIKPYPVCHFIHGCADAAIELFDEIGGEEIVAVDARLAKDTMPIVAEPAARKQDARTEYEAKFSAPFVVATCLLKGRFGLPELQPEALMDASVQSLAKRVTCSIDPDSAFPTFFSGGVEVRTASGRVLSRHVRVNSGAGPRALQKDAVGRKFLASASLGIAEPQARAVMERVLDLENTSAVELMTALRAG